tara:strand:+ start:5165 stop:5569 length:405 start_codon:yes stop_codon:yes gene_type:complete
MDFGRLIRKPIFLFAVLVLIIFAHYYRLAILSYGVNRTVSWYWDLSNINFIISWFWLVFPIGYGLLALFRKRTNGFLSILQLISIGLVFILNFMLGINEGFIFIIHIISIVVFFLNIIWALKNGKTKRNVKAST